MINRPVNISAKDGNVLILSEEEYNNIVENLYLSSMPVTKEKIIEGLNTSLDDCIPESEVEDW